MNTPAIPSVLYEAVKCLRGTEGEGLGASRMVKSLNSSDFSHKKFSKLVGHIPAHSDLLDTAISEIDEKQFADLKSALGAAKNQLHWKVDDGGYYADGADVGEGYRAGNMHTLLIGPENAAIKSNTFLLGFFLMAPWTLYRDHKHAAPEIYVPLTGPTGWRFGLGEWEEHDAGSKIFNPSDSVHATRVYERPFLALFAWTRDISSMCSVVSANDWNDIEQNLTQYRQS